MFLLQASLFDSNVLLKKIQTGVNYMNFIAADLKEK